MGILYEFHGIPDVGHGWDQIPIFTFEHPAGETIFSQLVLFVYEHVCPTVDVTVPAPLAPTCAVYPSYPNPFNPATTIRYRLPRAQTVRIRVFDVSGHLVRDLQPASLVEPGFHTIRWDGRDQRGQAVSSGVYYYRIEAGTWTTTRPMVLMR